MDRQKLKSLLIPPDATIKFAMQKLNETAEKILFVVNDIKVLGTVTDGDIRRELLNGIKFSDPVERVMYKDFVFISCDEPNMKDKARALMLSKEIEQIPVLDKYGDIIDVMLWTDVFGEKEQQETTQSYDNPVVIMAGGKGTRLDPFTRVLPKPLIPVGDKPILEIIMDGFYKNGFNNFFLTLNYKKEYIKMFLKENAFPYKAEYVEESEFMGTAGSLSLLKDSIKESFFVTNCDIIVNANYADILKWHKAYNNLITVVGCHKEVKISYGILEMGDGMLKRFVEKPSYDFLINTGFYVFEPEIISLVEEGKYMDMNVLIELAMKRGKVSVYPLHDGWFDVGQWGEYKASLKILENLEGKA